MEEDKDTMERIREKEPETPSTSDEYVQGDVVMTAVFDIAKRVLSERTPMEEGIEDINVENSWPILTPLELKDKVPISAAAVETVKKGRRQIAEAIANPDKENELLVVYGGCSVHDYEGTLRFAEFVKKQNKEYEGQLTSIMRLMFDKPRSKFDWPGFIEDPDLDDSYDRNKGLLLARELCAEITAMGVPVETELLNSYTPQAMGDFFSMYQVGARTVESPNHRKLAALVSAPTGMKNSTGSNIKVAIEAAEVARRSQMVDGYNKFGQLEQFKARGNQSTFVILRGGDKGPNYTEEWVDETKQLYAKNAQDRSPAIMIDLAHGNSYNEKGEKDHKQQITVAHNVAEQIAEGEEAIIGVTYEAYNKSGRKDRIPGQIHDPDISITDPCVDKDEAACINAILASAVAMRRRH